jgi:hypothetical protein
MKTIACTHEHGHDPNCIATPEPGGHWLTILGLAILLLVLALATKNAKSKR